MILGVIGLDTGANLVRSLLAGGQGVAGYDRSPSMGREFASGGMIRTETIMDLVLTIRKANRESPSFVPLFLMIPQGPPMDRMIEEILPHLLPGDMILDGSPSRPSDSLKRFRTLLSREVDYCDIFFERTAGSRGLSSLSALLVGGTDPVLSRIGPSLFPIPFQHAGPPGSAHFLRTVAHAWKLAERTLRKEVATLLHNGPVEPNMSACETLLEEIAPSREGAPMVYMRELRWAIETGLEEEIPTPLLALSHSLALDLTTQRPPESQKTSLPDSP